MRQEADRSKSPGNVESEEEASCGGKGSEGTTHITGHRVQCACPGLDAVSEITLRDPYTCIPGGSVGTTRAGGKDEGRVVGSLA